jgi:hypothetical protein
VKRSPGKIGLESPMIEEQDMPLQAQNQAGRHTLSGCGDDVGE